MKKVRKVSLICAILCVVMVMGSQAKAGSLVYTFCDGVDGYSGTEDTYIQDTQPNTNRGSAETLLLGVNAYHERRTMIQFDLSAFTAPVGETLESAVLRMKVESDITDNNISAYQIYRSWIEGDGTATSAGTTGATWNEYEYSGASQTNLWGTAGCNNTTTDRSGTAESTTAVTEVGVFYEFSLTTDLVNGWVGGTIDNNGVILIGDGLSIFHSSEALETRRPELVLTYTPEPATMVLLGLGGVGLLVRRRRRHA